MCFLGSDCIGESHTVSRNPEAKESSTPIFERVISTVRLEWTSANSTVATTSTVKTRGDHRRIRFNEFSCLPVQAAVLKHQMKWIIFSLFNGSIELERIHSFHRYSLIWSYNSSNSPNPNKPLCHMIERIYFHNRQSSYRPVKVKCIH